MLTCGQASRKHVGKKVSYLEDFDLAAGRMDMLHVFPVFIGGESVHLDTKGHSFLPTMLPGCELSADAVDLRRHAGEKKWGLITVSLPYIVRINNLPRHFTWIYLYLDENRRVLDGIPEELNGVEVQRVCSGLQYTH